MPSLPRIAIVASVLLLGACYTWRADNGALNRPHASRERFEVWSRNASREVHSLRLSGDTVSGVPYTLPPSCDSCRVQWLRSEVDSVRARRDNPLGSTMLLLSVAGLVWLYLTV